MSWNILEQIFIVIILIILKSFTFFQIGFISFWLHWQLIDTSVRSSTSKSVKGTTISSGSSCAFKGKENVISIDGQYLIAKLSIKSSNQHKPLKQGWAEKPCVQMTELNELKNEWMQLHGFPDGKQIYKAFYRDAHTHLKTS